MKGCLVKRCAIFFASAVIAFSQTDTGVIWGNVVDGSQSIVQQVEIRAKNLATGLILKGTSNKFGAYRLNAVPPGRYELTATETGFSKAVEENVEVNVDARVKIDFELKIGNVAEEVRITAETSLLESDTTSNGQVVNNKLVGTLPLNARNYSSLALLAPGSMPNFGSRATDAVSVNGQRSFQNVYLIDGMDNNNYILGVDTNSVQAIRPPIDAIQEFKLESSNFSAEYGHAAGGIISVSIKSGSNNYHGSAFEFLRNEKLDANDFFANRSRLVRPPLRRNQFGATVGGKIIPNRTFFFASYQGTRLAQSTTRITTVPSGRMAIGDFGAIKLIDPLTKLPFPGNVIPNDRIDPVGRKLAALYPLPNLPGAGRNFASNAGLVDNENQGDGRLDHRIRDNDNMFVRFSRTVREINQAGYFAGPGNGGTNIFDAPNNQVPRAYSVVLNETHVFSTEVLNEFRAGYTRNTENTLSPASKSLYSDFGILGVPQFPGLTGLPFTTITGFSNLGDRTFAPNPKVAQVRQFVDNVSWNLGKHALKFGGDVRFTQVFAGTSNGARGAFTFNGQFTGSSLGDLLLGQTQTATLSTFQQGDYRNRYWGGFVNDTWKVTPKLTLNLGIRYEIQTPNWEHNNNQGNFELDARKPTYGTVVPATGDSIQSRSFSKLETTNFAPRVGLAYQLNPKTVLRAAGGTFYGGWGYQAIAQLGAANPPNFLSVSLPSATTAATSRLVLANGFPAGLLDPKNLLNPNVFAVLPVFQLPKVYEWTTGVQREVRYGVVASVNYVGSSSTHLPGFLDINDPSPGPGAINPRRPFPLYGTITLNSSFAHATYESLQAKAEKRFGGGLALLTAYSYSHTIDNSVNGEDSGNGPTTPQNPRDTRSEKASSSIDLRHRFVTSAIYELPFGKDKNWRRFLLGGWQIGGIVVGQSGTPFTATVNGNPANTSGVLGTARPNRVGNGSLSSGLRTIDHWFDLSAFIVPTQFTYGNSGRNTLVSPGLVNLDGLVAKSFHFTENIALEFRGELFNLTNSAHFGRPNAVVNLPSSNPGAITTTISPNRQIQLGARLLF